MSHHEYRRHTTITPEPLSRTKTATIGEVLEIGAQHEAECGEARREECRRRDDERADKDSVFWNRIVALEAIVAKMGTVVDGMLASASRSLRLKIAIVTIAVSLLGASTAVGIFVAKYAIVGAITVELDKRLPRGGTSLNGGEMADRPAVRFAQLPGTP